MNLLIISIPFRGFQTIRITIDFRITSTMHIIFDVDCISFLKRGIDKFVIVIVIGA